MAFFYTAKPSHLGGSTSGRCEEYKRVSRRTKILAAVATTLVAITGFVGTYQERWEEYLEKVLHGVEKPPKSQLEIALESTAVGLGTAGGIAAGIYIGRWLGYRACLLREKIKEKLAARKRK